MHVYIYIYMCVYIHIWEPGYLSHYSNSLRAGRSGDRIPVEARIFAPVQTDSWGPPSLLYNGYRVFPRGTLAGAWCSVEFEERIELYLHSPSGPSWPVVRWNLYVYYLYIYLLIYLFIYLFICYVFILSTDFPAYRKQTEICGKGQHFMKVWSGLL